MRSCLPTALLAFVLVGLAVPAPAAPVSRPATLTFELELRGIGSLFAYTPSGALYICYTCQPEVSIQTMGSVTVDSAAGTIGLVPSTFVLGETVDYAVSGTTALSNIRVETLTNLTGTFSVGGAAGHAGEPPCPLSGPGACVPQTGFGGIMPLTGTYFLDVIPTVVVIPIALGPFGSAGSTQLGTSFFYDPAPWTVGTARISFPTNTYTPVSTAQGSVGSSSFRLVAPMYVTALGNRLPFWGYLTVEFGDGLGVPSFVSQTVPEPGAALVVGVSLAAAVGAVRRRRRRG